MSAPTEADKLGAILLVKYLWTMWDDLLESKVMKDIAKEMLYPGPYVLVKRATDVAVFCKIP